MSVRMRINRSATGNRRSHHAITNPSVSKQKDGSLSRRHRVSPITGTYKGKQVLNIKEKASKDPVKEDNKEVKKEKKEEK